MQQARIFGIIRMMKQIWYSPNSDIESPDAIHQILMFGTIKDIKSLKKHLGEDKVKKMFLRYPKKIYTDAALNFVKNFVLDITTPIDEQKYLKYTPRHTR